MRAAPPSDMIAFTSAKSRLIRPGTVISSLMPWMPWRKMSSASPNDSPRDMRLSVNSSRRSFGMTMSVSTCSLSCSIPWAAARERGVPSNWNGRVTTPMVRAPCSLANRATTGAAPVPVPPPMPAVMKTISEPFRTWFSSSKDSSAAFSPSSGLPPEPRPRVNFSPMLTLFGASDRRRAWASVLTATKSTPLTPSSIIRSTALLPPPPTPITRRRAKFSFSGALCISLPLSCSCGEDLAFNKSHLLQ